MIPKGLMNQLSKNSSSFDIEREGSIICSAKGFFCGAKCPSTIQLFGNPDIKDRDFLIHTSTGKRCLAVNAHPITDITGEISGWMVKYMNEQEYQQSVSNSTSNINIQNVNGPSVIGNQQNVTMHIGSSLNEIKQFANQISETDKQEFTELIEELESVESSKHPALIGGMFARFENFLDKYPNIFSAVGGWAIKLLIGQ